MKFLNRILSIFGIMLIRISTYDKLNEDIMKYKDLARYYSKDKINYYGRKQKNSQIQNWG